MLETLHRFSGRLKNLNSVMSLKSFTGAWESNGVLGMSLHKTKA